MKSAYQIEFELIMRKSALEAARPVFAALAEFNRAITEVMAGIGRTLTKALQPTIKALEAMGAALAENERREHDGMG